MNTRIRDFLLTQKVATVCCVDEENNPYCFSCFFAFDEKNLLLYFKSSVATRHGQLLQKNGTVAGTIQSDQLNTLAIKGIQFTGQVLPAGDEPTANAATVYHKKYPLARVMKGEVWTIRLTAIKMTDNTLHFGKKILWELEPCTIEA